MQNNKRKKENFNKESIADEIRIWERSSISLVDIRHRIIRPEEGIKGYRVPSNMFLYTGGGKAEIILDGKSYMSERFGIFHGGKGTEVSIRPMCDLLEYYMVLYRSGEPPFYKREFIRMLEKIDPFKQQYGFSPTNPIFFMEQLRKMYEYWKFPEPLELFYEKTAFYQLVYEIYKELNTGNIHVFQPDVVAMAKGYMDEHYGEQISIQLLCNLLNISRSHFHKIFTEQTGKSPKDYLINKRLSAVKKYLSQTDYTLKEIAPMCGFSDEFILMRTFRKHLKMTTREYKDISTYEQRHQVMESDPPFPYNEESLVSLSKLNMEGVCSMFKQIKSKTVIVAALSLMLLLTACNSTIGTERFSQEPQSVTVQTPEAEIEETRVINTVLGDVEVPSNPKRVIVDYIVGDIAALGIVPVGISKVEDRGVGTAFEEGIKEAAVVGEWELDPESVMALEPDLIILSFSDNQYEDLSKIAPTVYVPYGSMTTKERITYLGEVLNHQEKAQDVLNDFEKKVDQAKKKLQEVGLEKNSLTILQSDEGGGNYVAGSKHAVGVLVYNELGLIPPEKVKKEIIDADKYWGNPSLEVLDAYCGDYLVHLGEIPESLKSNHIWNLIPAVENRRIISVDTRLSWYTDILSAESIIDLLVDNLINMSVSQ
ncbi:AraC family transcriptional regulator [Tissierella praeacuta]|uniref:AraC family transcriptional regulator n=1 Tax=Tissierella praeacuta TaxID=43131 RepID=UPI0033419B7E